MGRTVQIVRRAGDGEKAIQCGEAVLKKRKRLEKGGRHLVIDEVRLSLEEWVEAIESRQMALSAGNSSGQRLFEL